MKIIAPAKINLYLKILGRRKDGYHELETVMIPVSLYDEIEIEVAGSNIILEADDCGCEIKNNLAFRAAELFLKETGIKKGVKIKLKKNIPSGAGLGGGSSDASAVLKGMNELFEAGLTTEKLMIMAATLGADCPFFVLSKPALMGSKGDKLICMINIQSRAYLIVVPPLQLSTKEVYKNLNLPLTLCIETIKIENEGAFIPEGLLKNDLEGVAFNLHPELARIKAELITKGALGALMSGSGSSVFGVFRDSVHLTDVMNNMSIKKGFKYITA